MASYKVAAPDEYLAITGMGIKSVRITKAAWVWPFQRCVRFSVQPRDYAMNLQAMTKEKLQFLLPVVFTIGPDINQRVAGSKILPTPAAGSAGTDDGNDGDGVVDMEDYHRNYKSDGDSLLKYAVLLADSSAGRGNNTQQHLENIIRGIIEGETRVLVSSMTMEEIFTEREVFKRRIFRNIQGELQQFSLRIYNANVKELKDAPGSTYFESLSQKAHEGASNQARIDVSEARLLGNVGEAQRKGQQDREIAKINADTAVQKTERDVERAKAEATLATRKTAFERDVQIAQVEATRATQSRDEDLKRDVEVRRAAAEIERLRASDVVKATIKRESQQQAADAKAYEVEAQARADFLRTKQNAEAHAYQMRQEAEGKAFEVETAARADLLRTKQNAEADVFNIRQVAEARAYEVEAAAGADSSRTRQSADAHAYQTRQSAEAGAHAEIQAAEASVQRKLKEAEGLDAMADAYIKLGRAFGGPAGLLQYLMIEKGTYVELAKANAAAIHGLNPKISVWNTGAAGNGEGGEGAGSANPTDTMRNIYQMLPPLMSTINEQTGITLPEWQFGRLANQVSQAERDGKPKSNAVNSH